MIHPLFEQLIAPFMQPLPQKSASQLKAISQDNTIHCDYWSDTEKLGWFVTELHYSWWPAEVKAYRKEWFPWDFQEWVESAYDYLDTRSDFWVWWNDMPEKNQRIFVSEFIRAHEPMIRKELDEYNIQHS